MVIEWVVAIYNLMFLRCVIGAYRGLVRHYRYVATSSTYGYPVLKDLQNAGMVLESELWLKDKLADYERGEMWLASLIGWYEGSQLALADIQADKCNRFRVKNGRYDYDYDYET
jgi:hypothetical protein